MMGLFDHEKRKISIAPHVALLTGFALFAERDIAEALNSITATAPFRNMHTPNGHIMSVAMTNCGDAGWVTDRSGYRYQATDPESGRNWPAMPSIFQEIATSAAKEMGFLKFLPDACLINRYEVGASLSLHQDKNEKDFDAPIVSVSLGLPATFLFGGLMRTDPTKKISLVHGDVVVWGGPMRLAYHGIRPLKLGQHSLFGATRVNLTFRKAL